MTNRNVQKTQNIQTSEIMSSPRKSAVSLWITRGIYSGDWLLDSDGHVLSPVRWNGQNKHRDDHLVTEGKHVVHVFYRDKTRSVFEYMGVKHGNTRCIEAGDPERNTAALYEFTLLTYGPELLLPAGTVCAPGLMTPEYCKWKSAAMEATGLVGGNKASGIIKHE